MFNRIFGLCASLWLLLNFVTGCAAQVAQQESLGDQLRKGGYVIFFRHGATDKMDEPDTVNLADCTLQRNLNPMGRAQAQRIGTAFRAAQIPVGEVYASEYCRCLDTATLAFNRAAKNEVLTSYLRRPEAERPQRIIELKKLLAETPVTGTNLVLVGHHNMFRDAAAIVLEEGEAAVIEPQGAGQFRIIAQVKPDYWEKLL